MYSQSSEMLVWCFFGGGSAGHSHFWCHRFRPLLVPKSKVSGSAVMEGRVSSLRQSMVMSWVLSEYHVAFSNRNFPLFDQNALLGCHIFYSQKERKLWIKWTQMCCCLSSGLNNFIRIIKFPWNLCFVLAVLMLTKTPPPHRNCLAQSRDILTESWPQHLPGMPWMRSPFLASPGGSGGWMPRPKRDFHLPFREICAQHLLSHRGVVEQLYALGW